MVPLTLGTDTAGSIRVPAALCGVVGFKPAYDAVSSEGVYPLAPSLDHVGVFAATSEDALIGHQALADRPVLPDAALDRVSVGWIPPESIAVTDRRIEELTRRFVSRAFDVDVVEGFAKWDLFDVLSTLQGREAFQVHEHHLAADEDLIDPEVRARLDRGREISDRLYAGPTRSAGSSGPWSASCCRRSTCWPCRPCRSWRRLSTRAASPSTAPAWRSARHCSR